MSKRFKLIQPRQWVGLAIGLFFALLLTFVRPGFLSSFESVVLDDRFEFRQPLPLRPEIVVIAIDDRTLDQFSLLQFPWPRWVYSEYFLDPLRDLNVHPSIILFDMFFPLPQEEFADREFVKAVEEAGNVVVGYSFDIDSQVQETRLGKEERERAAAAIVSRDSLPMEDGHDTILAAKGFSSPPIPFLAEAVAGAGFVNIRKDDDAVIRRAWMVLRQGGRLFPSLSLAGLMRYLDVSPADVEVVPGDAIYLPGKERIVRIPIDDEGLFAVNFRGRDAFMNPPNAIPFGKVVEALGMLTDKIPMDESTSSEFDPHTLNDKIVIVGVYAEGFPDTGPVPTNKNYPLSGLHANVIDNVLTGDFLGPPKRMGDNLEILLMVFLGLIVGISVRTLSPARAGITTATLVGLYWAIGFYAFSAWNWVLPMVRPTLVVALTYTGNTLYHFLVERRAHRRAKRFLSSYVSKNVAKRLLESGEDISFAGERAQITTLFSDIRGFTSLSERLSPDDVVRTLNEYFGEMTEVIFDNDGTLDKFMGDAIMVFFGHPDPQPDHAMRALRTAVRMQRKMKRLQERWTIEGREAIGIGIGINTGTAVVGNIGTDYKTEYTAIGDHVNVAFRIQGLAEAGEILITQETYDLVRDNVEVKDHEPVTVKGKSEPLRIYEVIRLKENGQTQVS